MQGPFRQKVKLTPMLSQEGVPHSERPVWRLGHLSPAWPGLFAIEMAPQAIPRAIRDRLPLGWTAKH